MYFFALSRSQIALLDRSSTLHLDQGRLVPGVYCAKAQYKHMIQWIGTSQVQSGVRIRVLLSRRAVRTVGNGRTPGRVPSMISMQSSCSQLHKVAWDT